MKISTSFLNFKKKHLKKKDQIVYIAKRCSDYSQIENIFNLILSKKNSFIFESVEKGKVRGRYTIIGYNPDKIWDFKKDKLKIYFNNRIKILKVDPLKYINELTSSFKINLPKKIPSMSSMLVGYFSYDVIRYVEKVPDKCLDDLKIPDVRILRPKNLIIYDDLKKKIFYLSNIFADNKISNYFDEYNKIKKEFELLNFYSQIKLPKKLTFKTNKNKIKSNITKKQFKKMVIKAKNYISKGDVFQVVLSQRFERKFEKKPIEIYNYLRETNPSPFMFYFNFNDFKILGSSPEILVRLRNDLITIRPIAGTRPRGINSVQDNKYKIDLLKDKKELAEHLMLLDLGRNDVGKVSKINSVKVTESFKIEKYSHVMHIVSNVVGKFNKKISTFEALLSGFPAGTVSGAPKIRAMEIIDELEKNRRNLYAGGIGYFTPNKEFDTCIALRTALIKNDKFYVQAGAGIVADSIPSKEYLETINKAKALMSAVD